MAAELDLEPLDPLSLNPTITNTSSAVTTTVTAPAQPNPTPILAPPENPAPKRQRRPSVRLGEIGDQPATHTYDSHMRRPKHSYNKLPKDALNSQTLTLVSSKSSSVKARSLTHLVNGNSSHDSQHQHHALTLDSNFDFGHHRRPTKPRKPVSAKRVRSNWVPKLDDPSVNDSSKDNNNNNNSRGDDDDEDDELDNVGFRDYDHESDSLLKENSPVHSGDNHNNNNNLEGDLWQRRSGRGGFGSEFDAPDWDYKERKGFGGVSDGVRNWLEELGLSRYTPVFEIHEVDDEVLPMLTLEDLKDMGINAVGSRRKMFSAIQKLRKGLS